MNLLLYQLVETEELSRSGLKPLDRDKAGWQMPPLSASGRSTLPIAMSHTAVAQSCPCWLAAVPGQLLALRCTAAGTALQVLSCCESEQGADTSWDQALFQSANTLPN